MLPTSETLIPLIQTSYLLLFLFVLVEGPLVTMLAGAAVAAGFLNGPVAYLVVVSGDLVADTLYYALGRWGRESFILKYGRFVGLTLERVEELEKRFESHGERLLFLGKLSHGIGGAFLVAAGLARMPLRKYLISNALATVPKSLAFMLVGYYFGQAIGKANSALHYVTMGMVALVVLGLLAFFISRQAKRQGI